MTQAIVRFIYGNASIVTYLLDDTYTTNEASPIASPRTAEPGPGTGTFVQTDGQMSIPSGELVIPTQAAPTWGDQGFQYGVLIRRAGRRVIFTFVPKTVVST